MTISISLDATGIALVVTFICLLVANRIERRRPMSWLTIALDALAVVASLVAVFLSGFATWVVAFAIGLTVLMVVGHKVASR